MSSSGGVISICNRALQLLGAKRIVDLTDNSVNARAVSACYDVLRKAELRKHPWRFAIKRASLAADAVAPTWGKGAGFHLPADCIKIFRTYPEMNTLANDFEVEGQTIYTNFSAPLNIRYIANITDANVMDPLFQEALSAAMAIGMCEELTQSNPKKQLVLNDYRMAINEAKKANAFETIAARSPDDEYVTARL